jgi:mRNA interferase HigB
MRIITPSRLNGFAKENPRCGNQLKLIITEFKKSNFENANQLKEHFPYLSVLKNNRIVLNINRNMYRLVLEINYKSQVAFVRFIGTHAMYDKIDANTIK